MVSLSHFGKKKVTMKVEFKPISVKLYSKEDIEMVLGFKRDSEDKTENVSMTRSVKPSDIKCMEFKGTVVSRECHFFIKEGQCDEKKAILTLYTVDEETEKEKKLI